MEKTEDTATPKALGFAAWATAEVTPAAPEPDQNDADEKENG